MKLPEYEPSDKIWQNIEAKLNEDALQKALKTMPQYEPNESVWNQIEQGLTPKPSLKLNTWRWMTAAASVVVLLSFYLWYSIDNQRVRYSVEQIDNDLLLNPSDDNDRQYQQIVAYCQQQTYVCENPEFKTLKTELDELHSASQKLKEAMGQYNTEPELMSQLADVEQQKTEVLKKMAAKI
jgi:hypothetical protein